jgi:hypothetical protein
VSRRPTSSLMGLAWSSRTRVGATRWPSVPSGVLVAARWPLQLPPWPWTVASPTFAVFPAPRRDDDSMNRPLRAVTLASPPGFALRSPRLRRASALDGDMRCRGRHVAPTSAPVPRRGLLVVPAPLVRRPPRTSSPLHRVSRAAATAPDVLPHRPPESCHTDAPSPRDEPSFVRIADPTRRSCPFRP